MNTDSENVFKQQVQTKNVFCNKYYLFNFFLTAAWVLTERSHVLFRYNVCGLLPKQKVIWPSSAPVICNKTGGCVWRRVVDGIITTNWTLRSKQQSVCLQPGGCKLLLDSENIKYVFFILLYPHKQLNRFFRLVRHPFLYPLLHTFKNKLVLLRYIYLCL